MGHILGSYRRLLGAQMRSQLQYRASFMLDVFSTAIFTITEFGALALVMTRFKTIDGWTFAEVAFLYGLVEFSFGLMDMLFAGFDPVVFGQNIKKGTFDQFLLRPVSVFWQILGSDVTLRRIGRITLGMSIFVIALNLNDIEWTIGKLLYLPFVIVGMVLFFGGLFVIGSSLTFWTVESVEAMNILTFGGNFLISYPMSIYQDWLRRIFTFIVPAIFLNYYPALYFLNKPDPFNFPYVAHFLAPFAGLFVFGIALLFWRFALKHYQSTGS
ncbi:MAG: ABC transporter permease [Trueperaceae bacterium]